MVAEAPSPASRQVREMVNELIASLRDLRCSASERLVRAGVSMAHLHLMWMLDRRGDTTMSNLAEMLDVSLSNATGIVDRMAERGLVERLRDAEDRRLVRIRLSDRGREALKSVDVIHEEIVERVLERLDPVQLERVAASMRDLREAVVAVVAEDQTASMTTRRTQD